MRKIFALKVLLRSPIKTAITFFLIAAASFTLCSNITDYTVTKRETENVRSFYHGVAALDNSVPDITSAIGDNVTYYYDTQDKPWPADEQIEEFSSLPGVTLADKRYMTAGLIEDYRRLTDKDYSGRSTAEFVVEGTYSGYEDMQDSGLFIDILLDDVTVLAGDIEIDEGQPLKIETVVLEEDASGKKSEYGEYGRLPRSFYDGLNKGTRCLVTGNYDEAIGRDLMMSVLEQGQKAFCILDGLGDNYLETDEFAYQKGVTEAAGQDLYVYDIVYTSDMRSIPYINERNMVITKGRPVMKGDTDVCVVNELFLETYHLSVGDKISIKLGDRLDHQDPIVGARALIGRRIPNFSDAVELKIIGAYSFTNDVGARIADNGWSYTPNTVFVPESLFSVSVPEDYEPAKGEFSVLIEDIYDVEAFREKAELLASKMDVGLRLSDGGFMSIKDSFKKGSLASLFTTVLYTVGAALTLFFTVYLYIGRNKKSYAIMRLLGTPKRKAACLIVLPFLLLSVPAVTAGGVAGVAYTSDKAIKTLSDMAVNSELNYIPEITLPVNIIILGLVSELALLSFVTLFFIRRMKNIPPLGLLQEGTSRKGNAAKDARRYTESDCTMPAEPDIKGLCLDSDQMTVKGKYGAVRHVCAYIMRHMRRNIAKTLISLILSIVLTAGIGVFVMAKLSYQNAFYEIDVKGKAFGFSSSAISELSKSELVNNLYYYSNFSVCIGDTGLNCSMTVTNDFDKYLANDSRITYAEGYDGSVFSGTGQVCLIGEALAEKLHVSPGDELSLISNDLYAFIEDLYEDKEKFREAAIRACKTYKVAGIIDSGAANVADGIFTVINRAVNELYGQPFPVRYCEFSLADNERLDELNVMLKDQKKQGTNYAPMASWHVDSAALENIRHISELLESLFPVTVAAVLIIGLLVSGSVIIQSATEAAVLRSLGVTKKRTRCMLVFEYIILCIVGTVLSAGGLALYSAVLLAGSIKTLVIYWALYLLCSICGAAAASIQITGYRILELLQVKE